jgi:hypothetical protein
MSSRRHLGGKRQVVVPRKGARGLVQSHERALDVRVDLQGVRNESVYACMHLRFRECTCMSDAYHPYWEREEL